MINLNNNDNQFNNDISIQNNNNNLINDNKKDTGVGVNLININ